MRPGRSVVGILLLAWLGGCRTYPDPEPALSRPDPTARAAWEEAIAHLEEDRRSEAVVPLRAVLARSPRFVKAHLLYQDAMIAEGLSENVEAEYHRGREQSGLAMALYARVATRESRVALLEMAVMREPDCAWTQYALGFERLRQLDLGTAEERLDRARAIDPGLAEAWIAIAMLRSRRFDPDGANEAIERYLAICPLDAIHWFKAGCSAHATGRIEAAVACYREAARIPPETLTRAIRRRDVIVSDEQRRRFEARCSVGYAARVNLAEIHLEADRVPRGIALLEQAVALDPERPDAHYSLGIAYEKLGLEVVRREGDSAAATRAASHMERAGAHWGRYLELGGRQQERVRGWLERLRQRDVDPFGRAGP